MLDMKKFTNLKLLSILKYVEPCYFYQNIEFKKNGNWIINNKITIRKQFIW